MTMADETLGLPWVLISVMTFITVIVWMMKQGFRGNSDIVHFLRELDLHQILTLQALIRSSIGFLILGIGLWSLPK